MYNSTTTQNEVEVDDNRVLCETCLTDMNCLEKQLPKDCRKLYNTLKKDQDKTEWRAFVADWLSQVGPSMGRGIPRAGSFDFATWKTRVSHEDYSKSKMRGRWITFIAMKKRYEENNGCNLE